MATIASIPDLDSSLSVILQQLHVGIHHQFDQIIKLRFRFPAELSDGFARIADKQVHFRRTVIALVDRDIVLPVQTDVTESDFEELADRLCLARGDHVTVRLLLLQHQPDGFHVFPGITPVAFRIQVAEVELVLQTRENVGEGAGDFPRDKGFAAARRFVIEENAVARVDSVRGKNQNSVSGRHSEKDGAAASPSAK